MRKPRIVKFHDLPGVIIKQSHMMSFVLLLKGFNHSYKKGYLSHTGCSKCFKIPNTIFLFSNEMLILRAGIHKMLIRIASKEDPDQSLIWVCTVCLGLFGRQLVFEILEHLP